MIRTESARLSANRSILFLAAQAFALGLTTVWMLVPGTAIFLATYGSGLLPFTYVGAAIAGLVLSRLLEAALRRRTLSAVAAAVLSGLLATVMIAWVLLWWSNVEWVAFGLLILVPLIVPVGFVLIVGQAGMLLDVRSLKALYARVVAGFALGFVVGGGTAPLLLIVFGRTEHVLLAAAAAAGLFLALIAATRRAFPTELSVIGHEDAPQERGTVRALLHNRYVLLIVAFQMLSAVESQWLDFLVFDRAARRYDDSRELARFISRFSAIAYGADILFLLLIAGILLRRFGLRYGLTANATAVLAVIGAVLVSASLQGSGATLVFVLIVAARVADLVFSDGTSRTSLSAAYQAVPGGIRMAAQATTEGLAVPVAIGISGVALLILRSADAIEGSLLPVLTGVVVATWVVVAGLLFREYRVNLLAGLRRRTLNPAELTIDGASTLLVVDALVGSHEERDVLLGLDMLTAARQPGLIEQLLRVVTEGPGNTRAQALVRLSREDMKIAADAARKGLSETSADVRVASLGVLGQVGNPSDFASVAACTGDADTAVRIAASAAMVRVGDAEIRTQVSTEIARLGRASAPDDRVIGARLLQECQPGDWIDRSVLDALLADADLDVVNAALAAIRCPEDATRLRRVAAHLEHRRTADAALDALVRCRDAAISTADDLLGDVEVGRRTHVLLARACRTIGGASAAAVLRRHLDHSDREVGLAIMTAVAAFDPSASSGDGVELGSGLAAGDGVAVVQSDLEHAAHALRALLAMDTSPASTPLCGALRDELELLRTRVLAGLSLRYGADAMNRVAYQLARRDPRSHALALEWLEVTLSEPDRMAAALLDVGLSDGDRFAMLAGRVAIAPLSRREVLLDLICDADGRWRRAWLRACAIYAAATESDIDLDGIAADQTDNAIGCSTEDETDVVRETLVWARQRRGIE